MIESSAIGLLGTGLSLFSPATKAATDPSTGTNSFIATLFNTQVNSPQAFSAIAHRLDVSDMSPYEIDEIEPMQETGGSVSDDGILQLLTQEMSSPANLPPDESSYSPLDQKAHQQGTGPSNLSEILNADAPANTIDAEIALLTHINVSRQVGGSVSSQLPATSTRLSSDTMRALIAMQG